MAIAYLKNAVRAFTKHSISNYSHIKSIGADLQQSKYLLHYLSSINNEKQESANELIKGITLLAERYLTLESQIKTTVGTISCYGERLVKAVDYYRDDEDEFQTCGEESRF